MTHKATPKQRQVIAHNDAIDSGNPMHDDAVAQAFKFEGALVPGVTVFGYMVYPLIDHYGEQWLDRGCARVRLRQPVYDKRTVDVDSTLERDAFGNENCAIVVANEAQQACAIGAGSMAAASPLVNEIQQTSLPPRYELPPILRPATRENFADEPRLGSISACFDPQDAAAYLDLLQDDHEIFRNGVTHPSWLLRQANIIVDRNFALGPWIHVSSELQNYARVRNGETVEVRAKAVKLYERKGHEYADLDIAVFVAGRAERLAMRILHRAIYRMKSTTSA